jgi:hypothetical protein
VQKHGNLDRVGRLPDLPDANWPLASSPALSTKTQALVPICAVGFSWQGVYIFVFANLSLLCAYFAWT